MPLPIEDYAIIGDCETAALVGKDGSIDWLCWPRFDSGACFAALLGTPEHGRWKIAPENVKKVSRRYRPGTLILETEFQTETEPGHRARCRALLQRRRSANLSHFRVWQSALGATTRQPGQNSTCGKAGVFILEGVRPSHDADSLRHGLDAKQQTAGNRFDGRPAESLR